MLKKRITLQKDLRILHKNVRKIKLDMVKETETWRTSINRVSCFNAGHIFVDILMLMHRTVMKFGVNIEAKHINDLCKFQLILYAK